VLLNILDDRSSDNENVLQRQKGEVGKKSQYKILLHRRLATRKNGEGSAYLNSRKESTLLSLERRKGVVSAVRSRIEIGCGTKEHDAGVVDQSSDVCSHHTFESSIVLLRSKCVVTCSSSFLCQSQLSRSRAKVFPYLLLSSSAWCSWPKCPREAFQQSRRPSIERHPRRPWALDLPEHNRNVYGSP